MRRFLKRQAVADGEACPAILVRQFIEAYSAEVALAYGGGRDFAVGLFPVKLSGRQNLPFIEGSNEHATFVDLALRLDFGEGKRPLALSITHIPQANRK